MKTIYKYEVPVTSGVTVQLPEGARLLCVQMQHGNPCLWAQVDSDAPLETRSFCWYGTGHQLPHVPGQYVGTVQLNNGALVFHLFEEA